MGQSGTGVTVGVGRGVAVAVGLGEGVRVGSGGRAVVQAESKMMKRANEIRRGNDDMMDEFG